MVGRASYFMQSVSGSTNTFKCRHIQNILDQSKFPIISSYYQFANIMLSVSGSTYAKRVVQNNLEQRRHGVIQSILDQSQFPILISQTVFMQSVSGSTNTSRCRHQTRGHLENSRLAQIPDTRYKCVDRNNTISVRIHEYGRGRLEDSKYNCVELIIQGILLMKSVSGSTYAKGVAQNNIAQPRHHYVRYSWSSSTYFFMQQVA